MESNIRKTVEKLEKRTIEATPGMLLLLNDLDVVYATFADNVFEEANSPEHRGKNFTAWTFIPCTKEDSFNIYTQIIDEYDPMYNDFDFLAKE